MNYSENPYAAGNYGSFAINADADARASFITKTYAHLVGAVVAFVVLETILLAVLPMEQIVQSIFATRWGWLAVLGGFMVVSWVAESWARSSVSLGKQYAGLGLYVFAEALIFTPLIWFASMNVQGVLVPAALTTIGLFAALSAVVFFTRADFSFLRGILIFGTIAAVGFIVVAALTGAMLGGNSMIAVVFIYAMIALACGYILYHTSNILHHYQTTQYVAAALALFASVALLFWYILQLFMSRD
ncbi:MAG: US12 family protein [Planctomycetales bacterium]|nr:US12 family protein [Planctomycetales bacterium]